MRILFVHNNFPGQYRRIFQYLTPKKKVQMFVATLESNVQKYGLKSAKFKPHREPSKNTHPALIATERATIMGQAAYKSLLPSKKAGFSPDIVLSHSGWGSNLFLKDLFPNAKFLTYYEWYYHALGSDSDFLEKNPVPDPNTQFRIRMKNTPILQDLASMDWGQSPTRFQQSRFPDLFRKRISVLHDGVDTQFFSPANKPEDVAVTLGDVRLTGADEVITYVARGMEPYRGFPQFMEAVAILQKKRPNLHIVILGNDRVAYGAERSDGKTYKEWALDTLDLDMTRLHMPGLQPLDTFRDLMRITWAHVYLTVPFVLSWSLLEAMSTGALIVGSDTEPVRELVRDNHNGLLVPFFEPETIALKVCEVLENKKEYVPLKRAARETILNEYSIKDLLPKYWKLIKSVANGSHI